MPLLREIYLQKISDLMESECHDLRQDMGLSDEPGMSCEKEPCRSKCPFRGR